MLDSKKKQQDKSVDCRIGWMHLTICYRIKV